MILGNTLGAVRTTPIRTVQNLLHQLGTGVQITGRLDAATVNAINGVFNGWDDAPPYLRTGRLSQHDVVRHLADVQRYLSKALTGAMTVAAG